MLGTLRAAREFQSTPSARRATEAQHQHRNDDSISIHALREEGDSGQIVVDALNGNFNPRPPRGGRPPGLLVGAHPVRFQSTPSARRATWILMLFFTMGTISIHALREEGDRTVPKSGLLKIYFNPRPPRGGRPVNFSAVGNLELFQSTPSARRATAPRCGRLGLVGISIHALREEGDPKSHAT